MRTISGWGILGLCLYSGHCHGLAGPVVLIAMAALGVPAAWLPALAVLALLAGFGTRRGAGQPSGDQSLAARDPARAGAQGRRPEIRLARCWWCRSCWATNNDIAEQIERLEVHYFANGDAGLHFMLLSDWLDSDAQLADEDTRRLTFAAAQIAVLNQRHGRR